MNRREVLASRSGCRSPLVTGMTLDIQHCQAVAPNGHDTLDRTNYGLRLACKPSVSRFDALQDVLGKEAALLSPPPLRTRRASLPAARSSLSNALVGTRLRHSSASPSRYASGAD